MESYRFYQNLLVEIEILEIQIQSTIAERKNWHFHTGRLGKRVSLDVAAERMDDLSDRIEWLTFRKDHKVELREKIESHLKSFEGIDYKVAYMRIVENKKLEEIAEELDYSVDWIKKVSAKVTRHLEGTDLLKKRVYSNSMDD